MNAYPFDTIASSGSPRERLAPPAAEPARAVGGRDAGDGPHVAIGERAQEDPVQRPVHDADAGQVPRPDHQVVLLGGLRQRRQVLGTVRKVRVHLEDELRARFERRISSHRRRSGRGRAGRFGAAPRRVPDAARRARQPRHRCHPATRRRRPAAGSPGARVFPARAQEGCPVRCRSGTTTSGPSNCHRERHPTCVETSAAAHTINTGSITGIRNRSCGKKTMQTRPADAPSRSRAFGRFGLRQSAIAPAPANRQQQQVREDRCRAVPQRV